MKTERINKLPAAIVMLLMALTLGGCIFPVLWSKPGYEISMLVNVIKTEDIEAIKKTIENQNYKLDSEIERNGRLFISYKKDIYPVSAKIEPPDVPILLSFNKGQYPVFRIEIRNEWNGQEPLIKQEMDQIADLIYSALKNRVGQESITIDRRPTGPPF